MSDTVDVMFEKIPFSAENVKTDSREVAEGDIFVALKGAVHDGHDHIHEALKKGASYAVCDHCPAELTDAEKGRVFSVGSARTALGRIAKKIFADPSNALSVYGVTGTNGKTTTVFLIDSILNHNGVKCGLVSTVFNKVSGDEFERSSMTTPDVMTLNRFLSEMVSSGKSAACVEMSSHALDQKRVWGIALEAAVFTNISPEHLDYHKDMETYLKDKSKIFQFLRPDGRGVLSMDDPAVIALAGKIEIPRVVTFGLARGSDIHAKNIQQSIDGTEFDITAGKLGSTRIRTGLIGEHNVRNTLAAVAAVADSGIDLSAIKEALKKAPSVPGRLDVVRSNAPFRIFVDYAHTPDALQSVLKCLRGLTTGDLICVFGCGGDRDTAKRPVMGAVAAAICDSVILTSDNPRTEDPSEILKQIEKGVPDKNNYSIIKDRRSAIREALKAAGDGDVIIIAGKGHENYQIIGERTIHFNDKEVTGEMLKEIGY